MLVKPLLKLEFWVKKCSIYQVHLMDNGAMEMGPLARALACILVPFQLVPSMETLPKEFRALDLSSMSLGSTQTLQNSW
jgi:hypothetical protein